MKRFNIHINFKNGDELNANVVARNQADAMRRLEQTPEYIEFAGNTSIKDMSITPIPIASIDNERFAVTTIKNNGKELSTLQQATALREIGEFMFNNFKDLI